MANYSVADGQSQTFSLINTSRGYQTDTIDVSGTSAIDVSVPGGSNERVQVVLASNAHLTAGFHLVGQQDLNVSGDTSTSLTLTGTNNLGNPNPAYFGVDVSGPATLNVGQNGQLEFARSVTSDIAVNLGYSSILTLDQPAAFQGAVYLNDAVVHLAGLGQATDYSLTNDVLTIYGGAGDQVLDTLRLRGDSGAFSVTLDQQGSVNVYEQGSPATVSGTALAQHVAPVTPPPVVTQPDPQQPAPQVVAVHDNTTGADLPDTSSAYTGPVSGVSSQYMNITPDNLNVAAKADSLFIKTGAGDDAIAVHGGTNVVDAGGGSNFLTGAAGFDTFFLDARNIPAASSAAGPVPGAIWDTIEQFNSGDAATLFGVGPGAAFSWQRDGGAAGHTGLTLHAIKQNGTTASLTLAGIDNGSHLALSFGQTGGANYLYVKSV